MCNKLISRLQRFILSALIVVVVVGGSNTISADTNSLQKSPLTSKAGKGSRQLSSTDLAAAQQVTNSLGVAEWLGPLAPMALSPFFAVTCLSGMSLYGGDWFGADNPFLGESSPLHSVGVFVVFLVLTVITSVPRLTKVSKPFVQAADQLEAWAGIITMLVLKFLVAGEIVDSSEQQVVQMGIISGTADVLLMIAAVVNVIVINSVKFFFEMLIWMTPVPTIDAMFEAANKTVCGILMMIYGYSPALATGINLCIFLAAAVVFRWAYRQEVYFRTILLDTVWQMLFPSQKIPDRGLIVFPDADFEGVKKRSRCLLMKTEDGWQLVQKRLLRSDVALPLTKAEWKVAFLRGFFAHDLHTVGPSNEVKLTISRRYHHLLPELCEYYGVAQPEVVAEKSSSSLASGLSE